MGKILLEGMEFFSYHGCFREEQIIGTKYLVDLSIEADTASAEKSDLLSETINYSDLYRIVKEQMQIKSSLLEHVAGRILDSVRQLEPSITYAKLKISKLNPPVNGQVRQISYISSWKK